MVPLLVLMPAMALAQELEPRAYSNAPVGATFLIGGYTHLSGPVSLDPSIPAENVQSSIDIFTLAYAKFVDVLGRTAQISLVQPYVRADLMGDVIDASSEVHRAGWGDLHLRGAINLFGHPALSPQDFVKRPDVLAAGASLTVIAPTGQYVPSRFINIGTNRWAFKPDVGVSYPIGNWFTEAAAGVWLFEDNDDFRGGQRRSQENLRVFQLHAGYNFRPGLWLAADYGHAIGGRTSVNGEPNDDEQHNSRVGVALSLPVARGWSTKLSYSKGTVVRVGGDYSIASIAVQYRWGN